MLRIALILLVCIFAEISKGYYYDTNYIKQKVDHFGYTNNDIFLQRYLTNSEFYKPENKTILFYTGNEGDIEMFAENTGFIWENADRFNALIVFAEHRYYGQSLPYGNLSFTDMKYLGYLTSEQALADFAVLIDYLQDTFFFNDRAHVIAVGGSYGGMLAAWMRIKYPHLVAGALASSAPVWQFNGLTTCGTFAQIVTQNFAKDFDCSKSIRKSWNAIRSISKQSSGKKFLAETFHFCQSYESFNVDDAIKWLSDTWSYLAMCNYPYSTNFLRALPAYPVKEACRYLNSSAVSDLDLVKNIFKATSVFHNYTGDVECFNLTDSSIPSLGEDGWNYQACTEMVQPMCQNGMSDMFEPVKWDFTTYSESCFKKYGVKPDLNKAVLMYGGKNINNSSNIIFTNGLLDPWSGGGVLNTISECGYENCLVAIVMEDAAHHLDLRHSNPGDPNSVKVARNRILGYIEDEWLKGK